MQAKKEKNKTQRDSVLFKAKEFCIGGKMILIAFENGAFPLAKQYPSRDGGDDWKKDEMDSRHIIPEKADDLLPSVKRKKRKTEKEKGL